MSDTDIVSVHGRRIWDSRGRPTVEVEVKLTGGAIGRGVAPSGASRGSKEALELRDGGDFLGGDNVSSAIANINGPIADALRLQDVGDQEKIDQILIDLDDTSLKRRLGGNATVATSLATLNTAAIAAHLPLWKYLARDNAVSLPLPEIQIFGGGAHAGRRVDVQDYLIMPLSATSFEEALEISAEVYRAAGQILSESGRLAGVADEGGWWPNFSTNEQGLETLLRAIEKAGFIPGEQVAMSLDIAASEFYVNGEYKLGLETRKLASEQMIELLVDWIDRFPIVSIEDPLGEDDHEGMCLFTRTVGDRVQVVGDDYLVTDAKNIEAAISAGACNAVLIKVNQVGTVTEAKAALDAAKAANWGTIVSARSGDTEDVTITHLAVGWNAGQLKVGAFARSERMAKWNEGIRIAETMAPKARYYGRSVIKSIRRDSKGVAAKDFGKIPLRGDLPPSI